MGSARRLLLLLIAVAALVAFALWSVLRGSSPSDGQHSETAARPEAQSSPTALEAAELRAQREAQAQAQEQATVAAPSSPVVPAASDGLWLCVFDSTGAAQGGVTLEVALELWRTLGEEHEEKYQTVTVTTDAAGRARIAARFPEEIEAVRVPWPGSEGLQVGPNFEAWPGKPDEVHVVLPTAARVRGRVLDLARQPVANARLELEPRGSAPRTLGLHEFRAESAETSSDAQGGFAFDTSCGWFTLGAAVPGEAASEVVTFALDPAQPEIELELCLPQPERRVRVRLASPQAFDPIDVWVGALGEVDWPKTGDAGGRIVARTHEELRAHGVPRPGPIWELELPRAGSWTVAAGGVAFDTVRQALPNGAEELTIQLVPRPEAEVQRFSGHVRDRAGRPLPASLSLLRAGDLGRFEQASTNLAGEFSFTRTARSDEEELAYLVARCPGYGASGLGPLKLAASRADLEIVLDTGLAIEGRIEGLAPGAEAELVLRSRADRFNGAEVSAPGGWLPRALEAERFHLGEPEFRVADLPPGEYELWIAPEDLALPPARAVVRAGTSGLVLRLGSGLEEQLALECHVLDALSGQPVRGALIELRSDSSDRPPRGSSGRTDAQGRCTLRGHAPGRWCVVVAAPGYAFLPERFTDFAQGTHTVELRLQPACTLDLELLAPDGKPRFAVELCATTLDGALLDLQDRYGHWEGSYTQSDTSGRATLRGLPAGRLRVVVGWCDGEHHEIYDDGKSYSLANPGRLLVFEHELVPGQRTIVRRTIP